MDWTELGNWNEYSKVFIAIFALVSPPIIIPLFLGVVAGRSLAEKRQVAVAGSLTFALTMLLFIFGGAAVLDVFGISMAVFRIAGGFLLFLIAMDMIRSVPADPEDEGGVDTADKTSSAFAMGVVPLAIPILAGPGAMGTVVVFANTHDSLEHKILVAGVILAITVYLLIILYLIAGSGRLISKNATLIFNKIMGLVVCAIAFEFILHGLAEHFPQLVPAH
ncbi:MAG: MarC family protein [Rhodospirillales bacterium]|nr:MarC family protein [Rhodospirillales bacterium]